MLIADILRKEIKRGGFAQAGLPSESALMREHGVARTTVRRALEILEKDGLVHSVPGAGRVVSAGAERRPLTQRITELITERGLSVGDSIPSEALLCEEFGVSRAALRPALSTLEGQGILHAVHGKGRFILALPSGPTDS
ncbi:GntR family transcriptional regulator [Streptomyces sp. NPDC048638]|uniref:GntR family transcriptional regulator n=1 Tax=Streptomyces sp. NPDC048638 TaxID=3365580 RepID=UPI003720475B